MIHMDVIQCFLSGGRYSLEHSVSLRISNISIPCFDARHKLTIEVPFVTVIYPLQSKQQNISLFTVTLCPSMTPMLLSWRWL